MLSHCSSDLSSESFVSAPSTFFSQSSVETFASTSSDSPTDCVFLYENENYNFSRGKVTISRGEESAVEERKFSLEGYTQGVLLGKGSTGSVYAWKNQNEIVAVKHFRCVASSYKRYRFVAEVSFYVNNKHPSLLKLVGVAFAESTGFIATEFMNLGSWNKAVSLINSKANYEEILLSVCFQVSRGLQYLHSNNYLHGDVSQKNVLLNSKGEAKLCDFANVTKLKSKNELLTSNDVLGALKFLAPERKLALPYGLPVDIWAFGMFIQCSLSTKNITNQMQNIDRWLVPIVSEANGVCKNLYNQRLSKLQRICLSEKADLRPDAEALCSSAPFAGLSYKSSTVCVSKGFQH
eukprot:augustus_masked-scaffold_7-processed-gene-9.46-mRNA-1 protein AED:0.40 eAED:0.42 QI:0/-1/0/1/-1/1/1/0/349